MRISDWSSDVCSSDLANGSSTGDCTRPTRHRAATAGQSAGTARLRAKAARPHAGRTPGADGLRRREIGRASCRERVCKYVSISVVAVLLKKKTWNRPKNHISCHNSKTNITHQK